MGPACTTKIGLVPLDERPVNVRYPAMLAEIAGAALAVPPASALSHLRQPANFEALLDWLRGTALDADTLIVSLEMLGFGGLIASRTTDEPADTILARLDVLRELKRRRSGLRILGFSLITRVSDANDAVEEPPYWATFGRRMHALSKLMDRVQCGQASGNELAELEAEIPGEYREDFLRRRARNHQANLAALRMLKEGVLDLLVLSSDDTSDFGLPSREKRVLAKTADRLGLGERLLMYPGADEVGCALVARVINAARGYVPRFEACYGVPGGQNVTALFEDGPVAITVERQVRAVGGELVEAGGDVLLAIDPPVPRRDVWRSENAATDRAQREDHLGAMVDRIARAQAAGMPVAVADVAYTNGADPLLIELLCQRVGLPQLAAYGGWNTAGNTIGTVLAEACAAQAIGSVPQRAAHERFLLHRFVEDWGYQHRVRGEAREWLRSTTGIAEPAAEQLHQVEKWIEARLDACIAELPGFAGRYRVAPGSTNLPWRRLFEVDFTIEAIPAKANVAARASSGH